MVIEPFELKGKTIKDCYFRKMSVLNDTLHIEFTDGSQIKIITLVLEDEISGQDIPTNEMLIQKS
jgi:hypothetical protein